MSLVEVVKMLPKEKKVISQLIDLYKDMPFLWNEKHKNYKNRECRNKGFRVLLEVYKKLDEEATIKMVTKKLHNLRTTYTKELKKVKESLKNGGGPEGVYVPTLWYFGKLGFLKKRIKTEERRCSAEDPLDAENASSASLSDAESDHPEETPKFSISPQNKIITKDVLSSPILRKSLLDAESSRPKATPTSNMSSLKKRRIKKDVSSSSSSDADSYHPIPKASRTSSMPSQEKRRITNASTLEIEYDNSTARNVPKMSDSEWEILGKSIGLQLRNLSNKQLTITQKMISDTIFYANMGLLSENSFVAIDPSHTQAFPHPSPSSSTYKNKGKDHSYHKSLPHKQSPQSHSSSPRYIVINAGTPSPPPAEYILSPNRQSPQYIYSSHESPPPSHI